MNWIKYAFPALLVWELGCTKNKEKTEKESEKLATILDPEVHKKWIAESEAYKLPEGLKWETNNEDPIFADPSAKPGGTFQSYISTFPLTMRTVGPDSNGGFRSNILGNHLSLVTGHPNTGNEVPALATHWAFGKDQKTIYYKINPKAKWSDGHPLTADDFVFALEFYRSKHIVAPWYNNHYTERVKNVEKLAPYVLKITGAIPVPLEDLHYQYGIGPRPKHFHKLDKEWVRKTNWEPEPTTGPYYISDIQKGKRIVFSKTKDWWAKDLKYFKHRFNVDKVVFDVIRDENARWEAFKKGQLYYSDLLARPAYWYEKSKGEPFSSGYVKKLWFYNQVPQSDFGIFINTADPLFKDRQIRKAFHHALNVNKLIKDLLRGDFARLQHITTGYEEYSNETLKAAPYDIAEVEKIMTGLGWKRGPDAIWQKDGQRFSVRINFAFPQWQERLVVLNEEARKAGVELKPEILDGAASFKLSLEKKHQTSLMAWGTPYRPMYWGTYHSDNANKTQTNNISNYGNPEVDKLIEKYRTVLTSKEKQELAKQIQAKLHSEYLMVPLLYVPFFRTAMWRWVQLPKVPATRLSDDPLDPFESNYNGFSVGGLFWIDEDIKKETLDARKAGKKFKPATIKDETYKRDS